MQNVNTGNDNLKTLYESLDDFQFILANDLEKNVEDNYDLYEALGEWRHENEMSEQLKFVVNNYNLDNQKELEKITEQRGDETLNDVWEDLSEELRDEIDEAIRDSDYPDIYQTYVVDERGAEILKDYGDFVYYCEPLGVHLWGVMHYGTAWSYVMTYTPKQNHNRYRKTI